MKEITEEMIADVTSKMKEDNIKFIRLQFVDINGYVKNIVIPFKEEDVGDLFTEGMLFDGSSIEGFVDINESDLVLKPDIRTYSRLSWRPEESAVCPTNRTAKWRSPRVSGLKRKLRAGARRGSVRKRTVRAAP